MIKMQVDTINNLISDVERALKLAKKSTTYNSLDMAVTKAQEKMTELRTAVNIEGTQMEAANEVQNYHKLKERVSKGEFDF